MSLSLEKLTTTIQQKGAEIFRVFQQNEKVLFIEVYLEENIDTFLVSVYPEFSFESKSGVSIKEISDFKEDVSVYNRYMFQQDSSAQPSVYDKPIDLSAGFISPEVIVHQQKRFSKCLKNTCYRVAVFNEKFICVNGSCYEALKGEFNGVMPEITLRDFMKSPFEREVPLINKGLISMLNGSEEKLIEFTKKMIELQMQKMLNSNSENKKAELVSAFEKVKNEYKSVLQKKKELQRNISLTKNNINKDKEKIMLKNVNKKLDELFEKAFREKEKCHKFFINYDRVLFDNSSLLNITLKNFEKINFFS